MTKELKKLLTTARNVEMSKADREAQRQSFAYGNAKIENSLVTRRMVAQQAATVQAKRA